MIVKKKYCNNEYIDINHSIIMISDSFNIKFIVFLAKIGLIMYFIDFICKKMEIEIPYVGTSKSN